jgi:hypothetical protein
MEVGATHAARRDPDEDLVRLRDRHTPGVET